MENESPIPAKNKTFKPYRIASGQAQLLLIKNLLIRNPVRARDQKNTVRVRQSRNKLTVHLYSYYY